MEDRERHSQNELVLQLKKKRGEAADRVRRLLQELENAEREFAAVSEELSRAQHATSQDAA
jgi:hypothetical protein